MKIDVFGVIFAAVSILLAIFCAEKLVPVIEGVFGLTAEQRKWVYLLNIWAVGYWGYPIKNGIISIFRNSISKRNPESTYQREDDSAILIESESK